MANIYYITTGENAYSFYDPFTGIQARKGVATPITEAQRNSPAIRRAINSSHLRFVSDSELDKSKDTNGNTKTIDQYTKSDIDKLDKKLSKMIEKGQTAEKIAGAFTEEEIKLLADRHEIQVEEGDTPLSIAEALIPSSEEE